MTGKGIYSKAVEVIASLLNERLTDPGMRPESFYYEKYLHSFDTVLAGLRIAPDITDDEKAALLLHDIGYFVTDDAAIHAEAGFAWLAENMGAEMTVLLPVLYHESDSNWRELLENDSRYIALDDVQRKQVRDTSILLRDADIVSNMRQALTGEPEEGWALTNRDLIGLLENGEFEVGRNVSSNADNIMHLLCGLPLLEYGESMRYLSENHIVTGLIGRLESQRSMSAEDLERVRMAIHENYDFLQKVEG